MAKQTKLCPGGTSFHHDTIKTTPSKLKKLFPFSYYEKNTGKNKVNLEFTLETEDGEVFTIYDWKEYRKLKQKELIVWHIGALSSEISQKAYLELTKLLK